MNPILTVLSAAAFGFLVGISFPVQITPTIPCAVFPWSFGDANSNSGDSNSNMLVRFWAAFPWNRTTSSSSDPRSSSILQQNEIAAVVPRGAERLPPNIVVAESDLHLRRLWGDPAQDTPPRKYLLALTVGYSEKANVNATVAKFWKKKSNFDLVLFHYDGRTTEWDEEFEWSRQAVHVSARKQAKWWYAKRFMHPGIVAAYEYIFLWDEDLGVDNFDAEEYVRIVRKHGLEISQPALDDTKGKKSPYTIAMRRNKNEEEEVHRSTRSGGIWWNCSTEEEVHRRPCSGFIEIMAPVFSRKAWACVWHMIQNDLIHGWGLDWNFWRCVDVAEEQMGVVDAQYVVHRGVPSLGRQGNKQPELQLQGEVEGGGGNVSARQWGELADFKVRIRSADRAHQAQ